MDNLSHFMKLGSRIESHCHTDLELDRVCFDGCGRLDTPHSLRLGDLHHGVGGAGRLPQEVVHLKHIFRIFDKSF